MSDCIELSVVRISRVSFLIRTIQLLLIRSIASIRAGITHARFLFRTKRNEKAARNCTPETITAGTDFVMDSPATLTSSMTRLRESPEWKLSLPSHLLSIRPENILWRSLFLSIMSPWFMTLVSRAEITVWSNIQTAIAAMYHVMDSSLSTVTISISLLHTQTKAREAATWSPPRIEQTATLLLTPLEAFHSQFMHSRVFIRNIKTE